MGAATRAAEQHRGKVRNQSKPLMEKVLHWASKRPGFRGGCRAPLLAPLQMLCLPPGVAADGHTSSLPDDVSLSAKASLHDAACHTLGLLDSTITPASLGQRLLFFPGWTAQRGH